MREKKLSKSNDYEKINRRPKSLKNRNSRDHSRSTNLTDKRAHSRSVSWRRSPNSRSNTQNLKPEHGRGLEATQSPGSRDDIDRTRNEKFREMRELDRATRTVFLSNLHIKVNEKDLFILFTQKAGKVTDIYIICDRQANKSKGLAYIELETLESMARALGLSGTELYGQPIQVKPSEMEKNVQWTLQKQAQQGILASTTSTLSTSSNSRS